MLVETYMAKEGQIGTPWYRTYRNDGTKNKQQRDIDRPWHQNNRT